MAQKTLEIVGAFLKRSDTPDGLRYGIVTETGVTTDSSGDKTLTAPSFWETMELIIPTASTLGTGAAVQPVVAASAGTVAYGGTAATTFGYMMIVSRR